MREMTMNCAHCGCDYVHHICVDIHRRFQEDGQTESARIYGAGEVSTQNPSSRRDGLVIILECEQCDGLTQFSLEQHKGQTFMAIGKIPR
jgi:hypothetical protein